jgi:hypothetical protein
LDKITALAATAIVVFFCAFITLYEKQMASIIGTVFMSITSFAALMAFGYHLVAYPFSQSFVKDKVFSYKFIFQL